MKTLLALVLATSLAGCATQFGTLHHPVTHKAKHPRHRVVRHAAPAPAPVIMPAPVVIPAPVAAPAPQATFKRRWHFHFPRIFRPHPK